MESKRKQEEISGLNSNFGITQEVFVFWIHFEREWKNCGIRANGVLGSCLVNSPFASKFKLTRPLSSFSVHFKAYKVRELLKDKINMLRILKDIIDNT